MTQPFEPFRALLFAAMAMFAVLGPATAQPPVAIDRLGPQIGDAVPAFTAPDQAGTTQTLASVLGPRGGLLVFSRSADW